MMIFEIFMGKLKGIEFTSVDGNVLISKEGFSVTFIINGGIKHPVQIIIRVLYKGELASFWGCENTYQMSEFVKWFGQTRSAAFNKQFEAGDETAKVGKALFNQL